MSKMAKITSTAFCSWKIAIMGNLGINAEQPLTYSRKMKEDSCLSG
jgi:hypothetical protein